MNKKPTLGDVWRALRSGPSFAEQKAASRLVKTCTEELNDHWINYGFLWGMSFPGKKTAALKLDMTASNNALSDLQSQLGISVPGTVMDPSHNGTPREGVLQEPQHTEPYYGYGLKLAGYFGQLNYWQRNGAAHYKTLYTFAPILSKMVKKPQEVSWNSKLYPALLSYVEPLSVRAQSAGVELNVCDRKHEFGNSAQIPLLAVMVGSYLGSSDPQEVAYQYQGADQRKLLDAKTPSLFEQYIRQLSDSSPEVFNEPEIKSPKTNPSEPPEPGNATQQSNHPNQPVHQTQTKLVSLPVKISVKKAAISWNTAHQAAQEATGRYIELFGMGSGAQHKVVRTGALYVMQHLIARGNIFTPTPPVQQDRVLEVQTNEHASGTPEATPTLKTKATKSNTDAKVRKVHFGWGFMGAKLIFLRLMLPRFPLLLLLHTPLMLALWSTTWGAWSTPLSWTLFSLQVVTSSLYLLPIFLDAGVLGHLLAHYLGFSSGSRFPTDGSIDTLRELNKKYAAQLDESGARAGLFGSARQFRKKLGSLWHKEKKIESNLAGGAQQKTQPYNKVDTDRLPKSEFNDPGVITTPPGLLYLFIRQSLMGPADQSVQGAFSWNQIKSFAKMDWYAFGIGIFGAWGFGFILTESSAVWLRFIQTLSTTEATPYTAALLNYATTPILLFLFALTFEWLFYWFLQSSIGQLMYPRATGHLRPQHAALLLSPPEYYRPYKDLGDRIIAHAFFMSLRASVRSTLALLGGGIFCAPLFLLVLLMMSLHPVAKNSPAVFLTAGLTIWVGLSIAIMLAVRLLWVAHDSLIALNYAPIADPARQAEERSALPKASTTEGAK